MMWLSSWAYTPMPELSAWTESTPKRALGQKVEPACQELHST
jgi:hypothetical protein